MIYLLPIVILDSPVLLYISLIETVNWFKVLKTVLSWTFSLSYKIPFIAWQLKEETEPTHVGDVSLGLFKPEIKLVGDFSEQEKMDTQSDTVEHREEEKFVTEWFIE